MKQEGTRSKFTPLKNPFVLAGLGIVVILLWLAIPLKIVPPWPDGIALVMPIIAVAFMIWIMYFGLSATSKSLTFQIRITLVSSIVLFITYLVLLDFLTFLHPVSETRKAKGFLVRPDVMTVISDHYTPDEALKGAEYIAETVWVPWSITVVRTGLFALWAIVCGMFALFCSTCILAIFQRQRHLLLNPVNEPDLDRQTDITKILFIGANPSDTARLKLDEEVKKIQLNLKLARERDFLELKQEWAVTIETLMQAVLDESPSIIHFSGHGQQAGVILEGEHGESQVVSSEALASLFKLFKDSVRCIVLNSCYSRHQAQAMTLYIPYVIGMHTGMPDKAAIAFSTGFYKALGAGKDIPFAFELGVTAIQLAGAGGEDVPVLLQKE